MLELSGFVAAYPALVRGARGDGHSVLVLPGFLAGDDSTRALRRLLIARGYRQHGWRLGRNFGPTQRILDGMSHRLAEVHAGSGRRVSIVGCSLGGSYARYLARKHPGQVRLVITLGSPFRLDNRDARRRRTYTEPLYDATRPWHSADADRLPQEADQPPPPVPSTAIYTRTDGIVPWRACLEQDGPTSENVEVSGSHSGLGHNIAAVAVILDRLALPEGDWRPYRHPAATPDRSTTS
jgi:pimeloyl-ACP methyl ester carboxylesterase